MPRATRILLFTLGVSLTALAQQTKASIPAIEALIRSHEYGRALSLTQSALSGTPSDFRLWTLEGIVFSIQGHNRDALTAFDKALNLSPAYPAALKGEIQILYPSQDKRTVPLLELVLKADPKDGTAHEMLAILEKKQGNCKAAIEHFRLGANQIDTHPDSLEAYGDCLVQAKQLAEAIPVFEHLSSLLPTSTYPKYDLGVVLVGTKQNEAALKVLDPLVATDSSDPDLLSLASEAHEAVGDTPQAVTLLRQAIVLKPENPSYYIAFAVLCLNHSSFQVGIDMINAGIERISADPSLFISRGLLYAQLSEYDKAEADFNAAERLDSAQSLSSYAIDLAEMQRNHNDDALPKVRAQLQAHPDSPWLHYTLARLLSNESSTANSNMSEEAIRSAEQAVRLKPDFLEARDLLAILYTRSNQYGAAVEQCRLVLQSDPSDEGAIYHLIIALRHSGQGEHDQGADNAEIQQLVKRLSALQQSSLQRETERNRYKLVEPGTTPPPK
jgi:tetratricopeptide (TPR) repeat protein